MALVAHSLSDGPVLSLLEGFLQQDIMKDMARWRPTTGTPQGAVISPLLANLYLHPLDLLMEESGRRMVRYADDFVILCRTAEEALAALRQVAAWVAANGLTLHPDKTRVGDSRQPGQGFEFLGYRFEAGRRLVRKQSLQALKDKVRSRTSRTRGDSLERIIADLNPMLRGWFGYFKHATPALFGVIDCAPSCASRKSAPASDDAKPIISAGPTRTSRPTDCSPFTQPSRKRNTPDEETTDWRAGCGRTARTVRRAGRAKPFPTPIEEERQLIDIC